MLDHSPHTTSDWSFSLEYSDAYWNGSPANIWAVLFVGGIVALMVMAIRTRRK